MDDRKLSTFDLDKLREAFKESVRERNVPASDWTEFAKRFLKQMAAHEPGENLIRRS